MNGHPGTNRRGFSLVEMVGVIVVTAVAMNVMLLLLHGIANWGQQTHEATQHAAALDRLEQALRTDLAMATTVHADGHLLTVTTPARTSTWRIDGQACLAEFQAGKSTTYERYTIGPYTEWNTTIKPHLMEVELMGDDTPRPPTFRLVATRGKNLEELP